MARLIYSMLTSLGGYTEDEHGGTPSVGVANPYSRR